jgi:hypothetical protein
MTKRAISITLGADNVTWLKGRLGAGASRSVSELVDRLVTAARQRGDAPGARSVIGTIDIDAADPMLEQADSAVQELFERSLARPLAVRERSARYAASPASGRKRRD